MFCAIALSFSPLLAGEQAEQTIVRMFSYDPHPNSATFAEKVPFNGKLHDFTIIFVESWQSKGETGTLKQISFKIQAVRAGQTVASSETIPTAASKVKKGEQIGKVNIGDITFTAEVTDIAQNKSGITDLTVAFKITYDKAASEAAAKDENSAVSLSGLDFARRLAERAAAMPSANGAAKISMYKRAIMAAPAADSSQEARAFHDEINATISDLEKSSPTFKPFKQQETTFVIIPESKNEANDTSASEAGKVDSPSVIRPVAPVAKPAKVEIPKEAVKYYKEARTLFAQEKGPEGREALRKALEIAPAYHEALLLLGDNASENRRWSRAKEAFKQALDIMDRDADTLLKYFKACYYIGEGDEAIILLEEIRNKYPNERRVQLAVAEANFQLGDLPAAQVLCEEMLQKDPADTRASDLLQRVKRLLK